MVIHYSPSHDTIACGRAGASLNVTEDQAQVSCKLCLRSLDKDTAPVESLARKTPSLAELRAAAKARKAQAEPVVEPQRVAARVAAATVAPVVTPAVAATAPATKAPACVRTAWQQRLAQLPGRSRLPRGVSRQAYV